VADSLSPRNTAELDILHRLQALTADALKELQRIISDLRPSHLDDLGLSAALRWYAGRLQELAPLTVKVDIVGEEQPIDEAVKITVFRIVQESLNNTIKHANATEALIQLSFRDNGVHILARDNGDGFDLDQVKLRRLSRPSLGLAGMEERAALLGGRVTIQSRPGYGTEVEALIPYHVVNFEVKDEHTPVISG